jgi:hypothetical protein
MTRILGFDVSKSGGVGFVLAELPSSIKKGWAQIKKSVDFIEFKTDKKGLETLAALKPDYIALEPTGGHYSEFWRVACLNLGIEILWVGHVEAANYRKSHRLPNKHDKADAYSLACYALAHLYDEDSYFLKLDERIFELRAAVLQGEHLGKQRTRLVNRCRQQLSHEWPEVAGQSSRPQDGKTSALYRAICGEKARGYAGLENASVARAIGIEVTDFTRSIARQILDLEERKYVNDAAIEVLVNKGFSEYQEIMADLGLETGIAAVIISKIYPIEKYRYKNIEGKTCWNIKGFRATLGLGKILYQSGDVSKTRWGGDSQLRRQTSLWVHRKIASKSKRKKVRSQGQREIEAYYDNLKNGGVNGTLANLKTSSKMASMLFSKLVENFIKKPI